MRSSNNSPFVHFYLENKQGIKRVIFNSLYHYLTYKLTINVKKKIINIQKSHFIKYMNTFIQQEHKLINSDDIYNFTTVI